MTPTLPTSDDRIEYAACPERRLMLAVLLTAILDAAGENTATTKRRERNVVRGTALGWIKDAGPDFRAVCELASLDPLHVRRAALDFIASDRPAPRLKRVSISCADARRRNRKPPTHV